MVPKLSRCLFGVVVYDKGTLKTLGKPVTSGVVGP